MHKTYEAYTTAIKQGGGELLRVKEIFPIGYQCYVIYKDELYFCTAVENLYDTTFLAIDDSFDGKKFSA